MPTFDIVSQLDMQEVRNAVDQAAREVANRYDFKGTGTRISLTADVEIVLESSGEGRLQAAIDVLKEKLVRRKVSLKALTGGTIKPAAGGSFRSEFGLNQGISQDAARDLIKMIKETRFKVQAQVQGDQVRVQGKKRDDLQAVIQELKTLDYPIPLQFVNFRE
jgi:uncharacterized protein YajQ (UPF0234 family)